MASEELQSLTRGTPSGTVKRANPSTSTCPAKIHGTLDRRATVIPVPHMQQCFSWDCGLACLAMVLAYGAHFSALEASAELLTRLRRQAERNGDVSQFEIFNVPTEMSLPPSAMETDDTTEEEDEEDGTRSSLTGGGRDEASSSAAAVPSLSIIATEDVVEWYNYVYHSWQRVCDDEESRMRALRAAAAAAPPTTNGSGGGQVSSNVYSSRCSVWTIDLVWLLWRMIAPAPDPTASRSDFDGACDFEGMASRQQSSSVFEPLDSRGGGGGGLSPPQSPRPEDRVASASNFFSRLVSFTTLVDGASTDHGDLSFYDQTFDADAPRVRERFEAARKRNWPVKVQHLALGKILRQLETASALFICLVDAIKLQCSCRSTVVRSMTNVCNACEALCARPISCLASAVNCVACSDCAEAVKSAMSTPYAGHYVVLCGYDPVNRQIVYRDPAKAPGSLCVMSIAAFDAARRSRGTDEDIIMIRCR